MTITLFKKAALVLSRVTSEEAFYFYSDVGNPVRLSTEPGEPIVKASSLEEFAERIESIDIKSLEFHLRRGDFEKWTYMLGDVKLTMSLMKFRNENPLGEKLRTELETILHDRLRELKSVKRSGSCL